MPHDNTMNANSSSRDTALREVQRQIEEGLESARRGDLLDGEAVMQELRERSAARCAHGFRDLDAFF
jgi:predicted transcriptional regulator